MITTIKSSPTIAPHIAAKAAEPQDRFEPSRDSFSVAEAIDASSAEAASLRLKMADEEYVPGEVLVRMAPGLKADSLESFAADYGAKVKCHFDVPANMLAAIGGEMMSLSLPESLDVAGALAAMRRDPRVAVAESNDILHAVVDHPEPVTPNDLDGQLWGLSNTGQDGGIAGVDCKASLAWNISTGTNEGPVVAVIDTGVDFEHRDLRNNIWRNPNEAADGADTDGNGVIDDLVGYNAIDDSGNPQDENGHGTHCAGTIGAEGNNGTGVVGVNWRARVMPVRFLGATGSGTTEDSIKCVLYASKMGAKITSNSWAGFKYNQVLYDALAASPALHVCAAGNEGYNNDVRPVYPASYELDNIISVAAHDRQDRLASFSNSGSGSVDLAAPGVDIYSTKPSNAYQSLSGTSMATPHVAGVATLVASAYPDATPEDIKRRILSGVDQMPQPWAGRLTTGGRLNALKALENDQVAPAPAADLAVKQIGPESAQLQWTATGDDGTDGHANGYELRYSDHPIVDGEAAPGQVGFDQATKVRIEAPKDSGQIESTVVKFAPSGKERKMYFSLKVIDNVGNRSPAQTVEVAVPSTPVVLEDNMDGQRSEWTADAGWARVEVEGRGQVWTDSPAGDYDVNYDGAITSKEFSLEGLKNSKLNIDLKYDVEQKHDGVTVEVYGSSWWMRKWRTVASFDGIDAWKTHQIDISKYDGQKDLKVRVRLESDSSRNRDGVYVDNVVITGEPDK